MRNLFNWRLFSSKVDGDSVLDIIKIHCSCGATFRHGFILEIDKAHSLARAFIEAHKNHSEYEGEEDAKK